MNKITLLKFYIENRNSKQVNEVEDNNIINTLNELSNLDPKCLSEDDYEKLVKYLPLLTNIYNDQVLSAGCNVIASLCSDDLARHFFGEKIVVSTAIILKSFTNRTIIEKCAQGCLLQACRAIGNLCYYHEENTKHALKRGCLLTTMEVLKTNTKENLQPVLIGLLLNLTHLDDYNYKFPDNMIEELNSFGIRYMEYNNNNYGLYINLISVIINIVRKSSNTCKITDYEKCSFIDSLLEKYSMHINITSACVKFIKQVSKTYNIYNWILKGKHKMLVQILDKYEENQEEDARRIVKKICNIIILLSNDDGSMDNSKQLEVSYLVEWLLLKVYSNNLYIKLSAVRALGNFSRFKYESNNSTTNPANTILKNMSWFINTLEKSIKDKNSLMEISILCLFKNILCVTNFHSMNDNEKNKLIKTTIEVLKYTTFNPIVLKILDVIGRIIQKGGISQKQLVLYKTPMFIHLVTSYCNCADEDINILAKKLLYSVNENINTSEINILQSIEEDLQIKD